MEKLQESKFKNFEKDSFSGLANIHGGVMHSHQHSATVNVTSTWLGLDNESTNSCDVRCDEPC